MPSSSSTATPRSTTSSPPWVCAQIELDVFADASGGLYDDPGCAGPGEPVDPDPYDPATPAMAAPGFKVLHIQDVDFNRAASPWSTASRW